MNRRLVIGGAVAFASLAILGAAVLGARVDLEGTFLHRLTSDNIGAPDVTFALPTIPSTGPAPVRLAVVGDVGTGAEAELRTAAAMDAVEGESDYDALLLLGDNVYPDGDPTQLDRTVFDPFSGVLDGDTQLLPVLGNHDVIDSEGDGDAQAEAIGMPDRWYSTRIGDVLVVCLDSTRPDDPDQLAWLDATLAGNDATWNIAAIHHPPYSGGYHGSSLDVRDAFGPRFERYGVQLVLAGHDHDYQRSRPINGVTYIISGGAATLRPANYADFTEVAWSTYHFLDLVVWPDRLEVRAVDQSGAMFDSVTLVAS